MTMLTCNASPQHPRGIAWDPIYFSGYEWNAKRTLKGRKGPGPNLYSSSDDNVWVDKAGRLHLRITNSRKRWWCAEVATKASLGYGTYRFYIEKLPEVLDDQAVLGMFTWDDNPDDFHREIDIEISTWGDQTETNTQFVVQPHHRKENKHRLYTPLKESALVYSFEWTDSAVVFQVEQEKRAGNSTLSSWTYTGADKPAPGNENARICFWLYKGKPPQDRQEMEVVISRFEFIPMNP